MNFIQLSFNLCKIHSQYNFQFHFFYFNFMNHNFVMATHILCHLALAQKKERGATSSEIARYLFTEDSHVRDIALYLEPKGLIKTRVGYGGGYGLAKKPENISLKDVFEAVKESKRDFWGIDKMSEKQNILQTVTKTVQLDLEFKLSKVKEEMLHSLSLISLSDVIENALLVES